jgi:uncharacterized membrane protein YczE
MKNNLKALEAVWDYAMEHLAYFGTNLPSDKCFECDFDGEFKLVSIGFEREHQEAINTWIKVADEITKNNLKIRYTSIVAGLLTGVLIEMWLKLIGEYIPSGVITCIIGIAVLSLGIATYTRVNIAPNPIDNFMVALIHAFDFTITKAKLITDIIGISIGLIIGGPIGIGTLLIVGLTGPLVGIFNNFYNHLDRKKL